VAKGFTVDPDGLRAMGKVAQRQEQHLGKVDDYILTTCNRIDAFKGVLNIFQGSYEKAIQAASDGMSETKRYAALVDTNLQESAAAYLDSDRLAFRAIERAGGDLGPLSYEAPGSGSAEPEGPLAATSPQEAPEPEAERDDVIPNPITAAKDRIPGLPLPTEVKDPYDAVKDRLVESPPDSRGGPEDKPTTQDIIRDPMGYLKDRATEASGDRREDRLSQLDYERGQTRDHDTYTSEYYAQRADGASPEDSRDAAREAVSTQHAADRDHADSVSRSRDDLGAYTGIVDETEGIIDNTNKIIGNVQETAESVEDYNEYTDYAESDEDTSMDDWAARQ
jgi:hypothetical protein